MQVLLRLIRDKTVDCCTARSTGTQQTPRDDFIDLFDKMGEFLVAQLFFQSQLLYNTECGGGGGASGPIVFIFALVPCE